MGQVLTPRGRRPRPVDDDDDDGSVGCDDHDEGTQVEHQQAEQVVEALHLKSKSNFY